MAASNALRTDRGGTPTLWAEALLDWLYSRRGRKLVSVICGMGMDRRCRREVGVVWELPALTFDSSVFFGARDLPPEIPAWSEWALPANTYAVVEVPSIAARAEGVRVGESGLVAELRAHQAAAPLTVPSVSASTSRSGSVWKQRETRASDARSVDARDPFTAPPHHEGTLSLLHLDDTALEPYRFPCEVHRKTRSVGVSGDRLTVAAKAALSERSVAEVYATDE